jgi:hypothetical protein
MPVPCSTSCGDYTYAQWLSLSEAERAFLIYCASLALTPPVEA